MFLAGYGGMVSLSQMSVAGLAGYIVAILGQNSLGTGLDLPWWLVVPAGDRGRRLVLDRHRAARGADRGHLHDHDHAGDRRRPVPARPAELRDLQRPQRLRRDRAAGDLRRRLAQSGAVLLSLAVRRRRLLRRRPLHLPRRRSALRSRRSATIPGECGRWDSMSPPTGSPPMPFPASSPGWPASCSSGSTGASRPARSASIASSISW